MCHERCRARDLISYEGDVLACVAQTERALWRPYWRVAGGARCAALGQRARLSVPRWPPTLTLRRRLAALQRRILAAAMRVSGLPGEDIATYCRRRAHIVSGHAERNGSWDRGSVIAANSWPRAAATGALGASRVAGWPRAVVARAMGGRRQPERMGGSFGPQIVGPGPTAVGDSGARCLYRLRPAAPGRNVTRVGRFRWLPIPTPVRRGMGGRLAPRPPQPLLQFWVPSRL